MVFQKGELNPKYKHGRCTKDVVHRCIEKNCTKVVSGYGRKCNACSHNTFELKEKMRRIGKARKGKTPWNMGYGDYIKGDKNPSKRPEVKKKISESNRVACNKIGFKRKTSKRMIENNPMKNPSVVKKVQITRKLKQNEITKNILKACNMRPTSIEKDFIKLCNTYKLPFKYVGDGSIIIHGKNPDFINSEGDKIVEIFGEYWHKPEEEQEKITFFNGFEIGCLVIWGDELNDETKTLEKVYNFLGGDANN